MDKFSLKSPVSTGAPQHSSPDAGLENQAGICLLVDELSARIRSHAAKIGVIGLGYVGLPLVRAAADRGFCALGFDIDRAKIDLLNAGGSYIRHISPESITALRKSARFAVTNDFSQVAEVDVIILCV